MGLYENISPGNDIDHSARRENDISAVLNAFAKSGDQKLVAKGSNYNRIPVCNLGNTDLTIGAPVRLTGKADKTGTIFDVEKATDASKPYAILLSDLPKGSNSSALVAGAVLIDVTIKDKSHEYADPSASGTMETASTGQCLILYKGAETGITKCVVLLRQGGNNYTGPFAVTLKNGKLCVSSGKLNCNGMKWETVPEAKDIPPKTGELCVCSSPDGKGGWTKPEIKIATSSFTAYPIAMITVKDNVTTIRQYPVTVAAVTISKRCPLARLINHA